MNDTIKILFVEDVLADAELIWHEIKKSGISFEKTLVDTKEDYYEALKSFEPDLIISDYSLPQFDGMTALFLKNDFSPLIPFILVTGSINEEIAVESMKAGADDYVIKQNLSRLGPAIKGALAKRKIIFDKKTAEKALKASEERFRMLFEKAPIGYQSLDFDGNFIEVNETWLEMMGYTCEEVIGKWFGDFLAPEFVEPFRTRFPLFKEWGKVHSEFGMLKKDGSVRTVAFDGRIGYTPEGGFKQTHCVLEDVTELRLSEMALKESEEKLKSIFSVAPTGIGLTKNRILLEVNPRVCEMTGYNQSELIGRSSEMLYPSKVEFDNVGREKYKLINETGTGSVETRWKKKNGEIISVILASTPLVKEDISKGVTFTALDISDRKIAEEALRQKVDELEKFNEVTVGRELKMIELKKEVNELLKRLKEKEKYKIVK